MSGTVPVQAFQIGQRVRRDGGDPFIIRAVFLTIDGAILYSYGYGFASFAAISLTLAPERPPYEPSERRTLTRRETDAEMAARHAIEWAEYAAREYGV